MLMGAVQCLVDNLLFIEQIQQTIIRSFTLRRREILSYLEADAVSGKYAICGR